MKLTKHEQKFRVRQQLACKFPQRGSTKYSHIDWIERLYVNENSVEKLVNKVMR